MAPTQPLRWTDFLIALIALAIIGALVAAPRVLVFGCAGVALVLAFGARLYRAMHPSVFLARMEAALWFVVVVVAIYTIVILPYNAAILSTSLFTLLALCAYRAFRTTGRAHPVIASFVDWLIPATAVGALLTIVAISLFIDSI